MEPASGAAAEDVLLTAAPRRIAIDADRCQGHLRCMDVAPDLVDENEIGHGLVVHASLDTEELLAQADRAVRSCPERAVSTEP